MSWQEYIDGPLLGSQKVVEAAIIGTDGSLWSSSPEYSNLTAADITAILGAYESPTTLFQNGLTILGTKWILLRADERSIYLRKGSLGLILVKTMLAVIVAKYDSDVAQPGEAAKVVEELADYLISLNV